MCYTQVHPFPQGHIPVSGPTLIYILQDSCLTLTYHLVSHSTDTLALRDIRTPSPRQLEHRDSIFSDRRALVRIFIAGVRPQFLSIKAAAVASPSVSSKKSHINS